MDKNPIPKGQQSIFDEDPRLKDLQKYWLQLTSYDLEKVTREYYRSKALEVKPPRAKSNSSNS